jgi:uncharacterized protein (DUF4415 family)
MVFSRAPKVNLSDLPELLPVAGFGSRCNSLCLDELVEHCAEVCKKAPSSGITSRDLVTMFPNLDAELIHALRAEDSSVERTMNTLLALSASISEPVNGLTAKANSREAQKLPVRDLGVEDYNEFPALLDADGWQMLRMGLQADEEELGSVWRDRAKAAVDKQTEQSSKAAMACAPQRKQGKAKDDEDTEQLQTLTDYECRRQRGERRAKHRVQYSRSKGRGAHVATAQRVG